MKNIEKYKDEIFKNGLSDIGQAISECYKKINNKYPDSYDTAIEWLFKEESIYVTQLEKLLLEHMLNEGYKYLARDKNGELYAYESRPYKTDDLFWSAGTDRDYVKLTLFEEKFLFVYKDDEKPTNIKEALERCKIKEL